MKILKTLLIGILLLGLLIGGGTYYYLHSIQPNYTGEINLAGLQEKVEVYYDEYGIPHIYAQNGTDAHFALGYVHAQDRLWQMELMRRLGKGRLAEILGTELVKTDRFFRTIGTGVKAKKDAALFAALPEDDPIKQATLAYYKGVNYFLETGATPLEYQLLGIEKEPFTVEDAYATLGYMAFSFAQAWRTDPLLTRIQQKWGDSYLQDLDVHWNADAQMIPNYVPKAADASMSDAIRVQELLETLPVPPFMGSNSWVIGPKKTKTGKVIFSNDTHIGFSQPSAWYEAYVEYPGYQFYGYFMGGNPFPVMGHNEHHAVGLTMFENDDIDLYAERLNPENPNQVWFKDRWEDMEIRSESIQVKDGETVNFEVKISRHGPIINDAIEDVGKMTDQPISSWWVFDKFDSKNLQSLYGIARAKDMETVKEYAAMIHAPGLNLMYGDADGNVAWWTMAKLHKRPSHINSKLFLDGASGKDEHLGFVDFKDNPHSENPPEGYVYSANNQPDTIAGLLHQGYYIPEDRAKHIVEILEKDNKWDMEKAKAMIVDVRSPKKVANSKKLLRLLANTPVEGALATKAIAYLSQWDGDSQLADIAPTIYTKWDYLIMEKTFKDELGDADFKTFMMTVVARRSFPFLLDKTNTPWWDDQSTADKKETQQEIVQAAFKQTLKDLEAQLGPDITQWQWQKVHTIEHGHLLGKDPNLAKLFNVGPFPVNGNNEVLNNMSFLPTADGQYKVKSGPAKRRIIDFADLDHSVNVLPTGQSGNPTSPHYSDQAEMFVNGEFRLQKTKASEIKTADSQLLVLVPK